MSLTDGQTLALLIASPCLLTAFAWSILSCVVRLLGIESHGHTR